MIQLAVLPLWEGNQLNCACISCTTNCKCWQQKFPVGAPRPVKGEWSNLEDICHQKLQCCYDSKKSFLNWDAFTKASCIYRYCRKIFFFLTVGLTGLMNESHLREEKKYVMISVHFKMFDIFDSNLVLVICFNYGSCSLRYIFDRHLC